MAVYGRTLIRLTQLNTTAKSELLSETVVSTIESIEKESTDLHVLDKNIVDKTNKDVIQTVDGDVYSFDLSSLDASLISEKIDYNEQELSPYEKITIGKSTTENLRKEVIWDYSDFVGKEVKIAGEFNDWIPDKGVTTLGDENSLKKTICVDPGIYQYRIVIDGTWQDDPFNPNKVRNKFGGNNSLLNIVSSH